MATVIAPVSNQAQPNKRLAFTHIATPAYVLQELSRDYTYWHGAQKAEAYMARVEVRRGNAAPADADVIRTVRGYFGR